jgi:hypothetical protein
LRCDPSKFLLKFFVLSSFRIAKGSSLTVKFATAKGILFDAHVGLKEVEKITECGSLLTCHPRRAGPEGSRMADLLLLLLLQLLLPLQLLWLFLLVIPEGDLLL